MHWSDERGSTSLMALLAVATIAIGFLAFSVDLAMWYVYRQQVRTALDAAVTAGAMQGRYELTVAAVGKQQSKRNVCVGPGGSCSQQAQVWQYGPTTTVPLATGLEKSVWAPYKYGAQKLWETFPGQCVSPSQEGFFCQELTVVSCRVTDPGTAVQAAREAYEANQSRWAGRLVKVQEVGPTVVAGQANRLDFRVEMSVSAEMPTRFMKMFGFSTVPFRVATESGRLHRLSAPPPGCTP